MDIKNIKYLNDIKSLNDITRLDKIILFNHDIKYIKKPEKEKEENKEEDNKKEDNKKEENKKEDISIISDDSSEFDTLSDDKESNSDTVNDYIIDDNECKYFYHNKTERVRCFCNINKNVLIKEYTNIYDSHIDKVLSGFLIQVKLCYGEGISSNNELYKYKDNICKVLDIQFYRNDENKKSNYKIMDNNIMDDKNNIIILEKKDYINYNVIFNKLYITYEYCGEDLFELNHKSKLLSSDKKIITEQFMGVIEYMKLFNYYHPDIKLENSCYKNNTLKIIDFDNIYGTLQYMPPEKKFIYNKDFIYTDESLVWVIAIFLYDLYIKRSPFISKFSSISDEKLQRIIILDNILIAKWYACNNVDINFICSKCLILNPQARITFSDLKDVIKASDL